MTLWMPPHVAGGGACKARTLRWRAALHWLKPDVLPVEPSGEDRGTTCCRPWTASADEIRLPRRSPTVVNDSSHQPICFLGLVPRDDVPGRRFRQGHEAATH